MMGLKSACLRFLLFIGFFNFLISAVEAGVCQGDPSITMNMCKSQTLKSPVIDIDTSLFSMDTPGERCSCSIIVNSSSLYIDTIEAPNSLSCGSAVTFKMDQSKRIECSLSKEYIDTSIENQGFVEISSSTTNAMSDSGYCIQLTTDHGNEDIILECEENTAIPPSETPPLSVMKELLRQNNETTEAVREEIQRNPNASVLFEPLFPSDVTFDPTTDQTNSTVDEPINYLNNESTLLSPDTTSKPISPSKSSESVFVTSTSITITPSKTNLEAQTSSEVLSPSSSSQPVFGLFPGNLNDLSFGDLMGLDDLQIMSSTVKSSDQWSMFLEQNSSARSSGMFPSTSTEQFISSTNTDEILTKLESMTESTVFASSTPLLTTTASSEVSSATSTTLSKADQLSIHADMQYVSIVPSTIAIVPTRASEIMQSSEKSSSDYASIQSSIISSETIPLETVEIKASSTVNQEFTSIPATSEMPLITSDIAVFETSQASESTSTSGREVTVTDKLTTKATTSVEKTQTIETTSYESTTETTTPETSSPASDWHVVHPGVGHHGTTETHPDKTATEDAEHTAIDTVLITTQKMKVLKTRPRTTPSDNPMEIMPLVPDSKLNDPSIGLLSPIDKNALDKLFSGSFDIGSDPKTTVIPTAKETLETHGDEEDHLSDETVTIIVVGSVVGILVLIACIVIVTTCLQKKRKASQMTPIDNDVEMNGKGIDNPLMDLGNETVSKPKPNGTASEKETPQSLPESNGKLSVSTSSNDATANEKL